MSSMDLKTPLIPQEIWLQEQYSSPRYFARMLNAWERMVDVAELAYDDYMRHIPSNFRQREPGTQVDIVWGNRVLPNLIRTLMQMREVHHRISKGDLAVWAPAAIQSDIRGASDYWHGWMEEPALVARLGFNPLQEFYRQQAIAQKYAANIGPTFRYGWIRGDLLGDLKENARGWDISLPREWPTYRLNPQYQCATGEDIPQSGIYLPDIAYSCAQLMVRLPDAPEASMANVGRTPDGIRYNHLEPAVWTLVERVADTGGGLVDTRLITAAQENSLDEESWLSALAGEACPREGIWLCPRMNMREVRLRLGEPMPGAGEPGLSGSLIWYWKSAL